MAVPFKNKTFNYIRAVAGRARLYPWVLLGIQVALGIIGVGSALVLREVVDAATGGDEAGFRLWIVAFVAVIAVQVMLNAFNRRISEQGRSSLENKFKQHVLTRLLTQDYVDATRLHTAERMNRLTSDVPVVANGFASILPDAGGTLVRLVAAVAALAWVEPLFLVVLVPFALVYIPFASNYRRRLKSMHKDIQEADGALRVYMQERLSNLLVVRSFGQENSTLAGARRRMDAHKDVRMKRNADSNTATTAFSAAMQLIMVIGVIWGGRGILNGTMSYGDLMAIVQLVAQVRQPLNGITGILPRYYSMLASAERLMETECWSEGDDTGTSTQGATGVNTAEELEPDFADPAFYQNDFKALVLDDATFSYPDAQDPDEMRVLTHLSLRISKGEFVAITGHSGLGKSTILKLLMSVFPLNAGERWVEANSGRVSLDTRALPLFAYVPQGNGLMSGTIREAVCFGDTALMAEDESIWRALRVACADDFVAQLPDGLETHLGEGGTGLSEGQVQRLAVARAVLFARPILLLDEVTSSLDEETEARLLENLRSMTDVTVVAVTHRLQSIAAMDRVINLEEILEV